VANEQELVLRKVTRDRECPDCMASPATVDAIKDARHCSFTQSDVKAVTIMFRPIG